MAGRLLSDVVYQGVLELLASPSAQAGARLPGEHALAGQFGVSRPVVRQALTRLRSEGRIYTRKGSGNYASAAPGAPVSLSFGAFDSLADVHSFLEYRCSLEGEIAAHAAQFGKPELIAAIGERMEAMAQAMAAGEPGIEEDVAFHRAVAEASGNRYFILTLAAVVEQSRFCIRLVRELSTQPLPARFADVLGEHRRVQQAIAARDPQAAREAMRAHLRSGIGRLFHGTAHPA